MFTCHVEMMTLGFQFPLSHRYFATAQWVKPTARHAVSRFRNTTLISDFHIVLHCFLQPYSLCNYPLADLFLNHLTCPSDCIFRSHVLWTLSAHLLLASWYFRWYSLLSACSSFKASRRPCQASLNELSEKLLVHFSLPNSWCQMFKNLLDT